ncbi:MbtH family protein [Agrobacterium burrii]|uniref:MbtH family protein n=1 Tax=Agrobacterium burrii TaxID=2815339 RepID=A0ABS3EJ64_9HYPH|nr:MbtH family protein [Agrobacterium burrii]MBO0132023.1 MbtH family protein [Agrobacterium burrii]
MTVNPFDDENGLFYALVNDEEQYSLWPTFKTVPDGWEIAYSAPDGAPRHQVLDWIEKTWTDMRPKSLRGRHASSTQHFDVI